MKKQNKNNVVTIDDVAKQVEELAIITSKGFDHVEERFEAIDRRFEEMETRFEKRFFEIEMRLDKIWIEVGTMRRDVYDIKAEMIRREEFEQLIARVEFLEKKLKVRV